MYRDFYGLRDEPFALTSDTAFFFNDPVRREAFGTLVQGVRSGGSLIKIVGEVGTGKTTLGRRFLRVMEGEAALAYIQDPVLRGGELVGALARELGLNPEGRDLADLLEAVKGSVLRSWEGGRPVVLVLDEAQALPLETLEQLRLLAGLETARAKLLRIVLMGQPELDLRLEDPALLPLREKVTHSFRLVPLRREDLGSYLEHRLRVAGRRGDPLFRADALQALYRRTRGIPRQVNILAHKALLAAHAEGEPQVRKRHVRAADQEAEVGPPAGGPPLGGAWAPPFLLSGEMVLRMARMAGKA
ncbi:ExeA family protein [Thiohalorhabdus denitrificans]|uniref:MSHA biogenesis protein MshM n=1 Tax=Thiohalorhabdus denitrificans TaxID=381306 RepID=A0A1G5B4Z4_9GAMM|nr:AAA family ATPase [Thiohalorhabdus denitrificans]SCX85193.1 MSHA biogenesis protein MshM [Thiohalorhabdus denitrificans]